MNLPRKWPKICLLIIGILVLISLNTLAMVETDLIFVIDQEGTTLLRHKWVYSVDDPENYLPSSKIDLEIDKDVDEVEFFDDFGRLTYSEKARNTENRIFTIFTKEVNYGTPYSLLYEYQLANYTTTRFKDNYHFEYPLRVSEDRKISVKACIPLNGITQPVNFDGSKYFWPHRSLPKNEYQAWSVISDDGSQFSVGQSRTGSCPVNTKLLQRTNQNQELIELNFRVPGTDTGIFSSEFGNLVVSGPEIYRAIMERNIREIVGTIGFIESSLKLKSPDRYSISFLSDANPIFEDAFMISDSFGEVSIKTSVITSDEDSLIQINILRGVVTSAMLNTYGEGNKNWWTQGANTIMASRLMKDAGLRFDLIENTIAEQKNLMREIKPSDYTPFIENSTSSETLLIDTLIVNEIEKLCPDHWIIMNKATREIDARMIHPGKNFNNYLAIMIDRECDRDISPILDRFQIEHDDIHEVKSRIEEVKEKISLFDQQSDLPPLYFGIRKRIGEAESSLRLGDIENALLVLDGIGTDYGRLFESAEFLSKIENVRSIYSSIPKELRSSNEISILSRLERAESLIREDKLNENRVFFDELNKTISQSSSIFPPEIQSLIKEYTDVQFKTNSIPSIFYFPSKFMAYILLGESVKKIKNGSYDPARASLGKATFWNDNAIILSILSYIGILGSWFLVFRIFFKKNLDRLMERKKQYSH